MIFFSVAIVASSFGLLKHHLVVGGVWLNRLGIGRIPHDPATLYWLHGVMQRQGERQQDCENHFPPLVLQPVVGEVGERAGA